MIESGETRPAGGKGPKCDRPIPDCILEGLTVHVNQALPTIYNATVLHAAGSTLLTLKPMPISSVDTGTLQFWLLKGV